MKVHIIPFFRGEDKGEGGIRRVVEAQEKWLPEYGIEIVDCIDKADLVATHAGHIADIPVGKPWVMHCHGLYWAEYIWSDWCYTLNKRVIESMRRADHVTAPSEWVANALRRGMWLRPTVLYHGIEPEQWQGGVNSKYVLWNKTRTDPICDPSPVNQLAEMVPDIKFITTYGQPADNVKVTGTVGFEEARQILTDAGVYLCTTRETMGVGTLEAMAAGVPVLAWKWGGQAEFIRHKETGWLCNPGDFDGLLEGLHWCIENREKVAKAAKQDVLERFTWARVMESYVYLYMQLLEDSIKQSKAPKVSVVIPCYNLAKYLPDAVKSVQNQTMSDWEIIIVDDASPDNTQELAVKFINEDDRIHLVRNNKNLYLAGSLNEGIKASAGRYIVPLDADNQLADHTLKTLSDHLDQYREHHIAYGSCKFVLDDGVTPDASVGMNGMSRWPTEFRFRDQMLHRNQIPSTSMYRKEVWERTGGYRTICRTAEDAYFWTRAVSYGFVPKKVSNAPTLIYRQRGDSMSHAETDWNWTGWFPWSLQMKLTPFGAAVDPPQKQGVAWPVPSYEPSKVAVIIPVGPGHEEMLIHALDSVEAQTFREWECIVVDDTGKGIDIPHPWAKVIRTGGGKGPAACRNMAISVAKAWLFLPLDADDYLQPDALELMYAVWKEHGGVVYSQWWDDFGDECRVYDPQDYDAELLISKGCLHAVTALYPVSAWQDVGGFDEHLSHWEDWDFQIKLAMKGICGTKIPSPLFTYRKNTGFRREENQVEFDKGKEAILKKWGNLWEGKEKFMGCCSGGAKIAKPALPPTDIHQGVREGLVLIEFIGLSPATMTFRGKATRTQYRFGNNPGHKRKYVFPKDAEYLLSIAGQFREIKPMTMPTDNNEPSLRVLPLPKRNNGSDVKSPEPALEAK